MTKEQENEPYYVVEIERTVVQRLKAVVYAEDTGIAEEIVEDNLLHCPEVYDGDWETTDNGMEDWIFISVEKQWP